MHTTGLNALKRLNVGFFFVFFKQRCTDTLVQSVFFFQSSSVKRKGGIFNVFSCVSQMLGQFIARAIADHVLPMSFLDCYKGKVDCEHAR